jgi:hypothetical protein
MITTHTRKTDHGYTGYIKVTDGPMRWTEGTHITRLTREDAKRDAEDLKHDLILTSKNA